MTGLDATFARHDLYALPKGEVAALARRLSLPHLAAFVASIERLQEAPVGTIRRYLRDLAGQAWFAVASPVTGRMLRSGCSLLLTDKTVVFSFPDEPTLLVGTGDLGRGNPICAALLTDRAVLLGLAATDWGFSERHLPGLAEVVKATGWTPGPATQRPTLVLGDANFAHYAWNQLSAIEELLQGEMVDGISLVATQQPLGPVREIFPALATWPLTVTPDTGLQALNTQGALFVPVGGRLLTATLARHVLAFAESHFSPVGRAIETALAAVVGPVLWISVRTRNRTATNQREMLIALGQCFLNAAPDGAIVIDGFSVSADVASYPSYHQDEARDLVCQDRAAAEEIRQGLDGGEGHSRVHLAVGLSITDSIILSRRADIYFCHHGTVQHKIGWFHSKPGVVHGNRATLSQASAAWVAAQSEVAIPPHYLSPTIVRDADVTPGTNSEFGHLLQQDNYTITDIPAAIDAFFRLAADETILLAIPRRDRCTADTGSRHLIANTVSAFGKRLMRVLRRI